MAYVCELKPGHRVHLDNQGDQTIVTVTLQMPGQQQQTSNSMTTGAWTAPPEAYKSDDGTVFKLLTTQGEVCISIQGNSVTSNVSSGLGARLSMQQAATSSTTSSTTAGTMSMGTMSMKPMEMRMGNMELKMDAVNQPSTTTRQFCSQCGAKVAPEDRFCSSCGHGLS